MFNFLNDLGATKQANAVMQLFKESFVKTQNNLNNGKVYTLSVDGEVLENVREVTISYGKSGYSYLFWHDDANNRVLILTIKHFRENTYRVSLLSLY